MHCWTWRTRSHDFHFKRNSALCLGGGGNRKCFLKTKKANLNPKTLAEEILQLYYSAETPANRSCARSKSRNIPWFCEELSWERSHCHVSQQFTVIQTCGWIHNHRDSVPQLQTIKGTDSGTTATHCLVSSSHLCVHGKLTCPCRRHKDPRANFLKVFRHPSTRTSALRRDNRGHKTSLSFGKRKKKTSFFPASNEWIKVPPGFKSFYLANNEG